MDENKEGEVQAASNGAKTPTETPVAPLKDEPQTHRLHLPPLPRWLHLGQPKQPETLKNPGPPTGGDIYEPGSREEKENLDN